MKQDKDALGNRMKDHEHRTRILLPRRTNTMIRLDGKAFHTFTKGFKRPFDTDLMNIMNQTALETCSTIQGAKFAYVQSDEITILVTDYETDAWFDGNIQKMTSISASYATSAFNAHYGKYIYDQNPSEFDPLKVKKANFDSRVWTLADPNEVINVLIWRQQDCVKNSISMAAQSMFSQKELQNKHSDDMQEMMWQKGVNWNDYTVGEKRGRFIEKISTQKDIEYIDKRTGEKHIKEGVIRSKWKVVEPPTFSTDKDFIRRFMPI